MDNKKHFWRSLRFVFTFIFIFWVVHIFSFFIPLQQFGLIPRTARGLIGIITSPFLHANFYHLYANTIGMLTFGIIFSFLEDKNSVHLIIEIIIMQGVMLWVLGRDGNHIGASGLIFGLLGYLLFVGFFRRRPKFIIISLGVLFFYGGAIVGILPTHRGISWDGHLYGFVIGCLEARFKN